MGIFTREEFALMGMEPENVSTLHVQALWGYKFLISL